MRVFLETALPNLRCANALHRMRGKPSHKAEKARHVGQLGMVVEGGFVRPLGVNVKDQRLTNRFVEMDADAAGLRARRLQKKL